MRKKERGLRGGRGQTLIEIMLAFSVAMLVLSAVVVGISTSLSNTQFSKNQNLANSYAQEAMAVVKQIKDSSWSNFTSNYLDNTYCLDQGATDITIHVPQDNCIKNVGIFTREVQLNHNLPPESLECPNNSKVTVTVSWADSKCPTGDIRCHKVELVSCFSNLDQKSQP